MKILLIGNYGPDNQQSMQRFAEILHRGLASKGYETRLIRPEPLFYPQLFRKFRSFRWLGYLDKFLTFPLNLRNNLKWADVVHICDHSNAFYVKSIKGRKHVITCHDVLAIRSALGELPEHKTGLTGRMLQKIILDGLNQAQAVAAVSETTRDDLLRISKLQPEKTIVIQNGLNYPYSRMNAGESQAFLCKLGISSDKPFVLHISGNQWYKNRIGVIRIFQNLVSDPQFRNMKLCLAGAPLTPQMRKLISLYRLENTIYEIISPNNESLCALYSSAKALLYPSFYEGFGWPILEAQACGCPVFTTNKPPMTEVGGDAAAYISPKDNEKSADIMKSYLSDDVKIMAMVDAGYKNSKKFSTDKMLDAYIKLYTMVFS